MSADTIPSHLKPLYAFDPVYSDARDISPVIFEAVFPDNEEVRNILSEILETPVFAEIPGSYMTDPVYTSVLHFDSGKPLAEEIIILPVHTTAGRISPFFYISINKRDSQVFLSISSFGFNCGLQNCGQNCFGLSSVSTATAYSA